MRCDLVGTSALVLAFVASVGLAAAQQQPPPNASPPANAVFVNGALAVPGAPANTDTVPAKFSAKNAADDKRNRRHLEEPQSAKTPNTTRLVPTSSTRSFATTYR